jgi:hypothetical protein
MLSSCHHHVIIMSSSNYHYHPQQYDTSLKLTFSYSNIGTEAIATRVENNITWVTYNAAPEGHSAVA